MSGAGTSEGWEETGRYTYECKLHPNWKIESHVSWIYYCEQCGKEVRGPQVEGHTDD